MGFPKFVPTRREELGRDRCGKRVVAAERSGSLTFSQPQMALYPTYPGSQGLCTGHSLGYSSTPRCPPLDSVLPS